MNESKFYADDDKILGRDVNTNEGVQILQADIDATSDWVDDGKCAIVHMGKGNLKATYTIRRPDCKRVELRAQRRKLMWVL